MPQSGSTHDDVRIHKTETAPLVGPGHDFASVTDKISSLVLKRKTPIWWFIGFAIAFSITMMLLLTITNLVFTGIGIWGNNAPVGWAFDIINFVWWIGIGHAGTLISAILLLLRQEWRTSINRFAEAMTLFAVACAGLFPLLHTGRPWLAYWLFPYPNTMGIQPQFRSPLMWDVFAVSTYATVSALFWFIGLIPDFATLRDRAKSKAWAKVYGLLAMGWRGSARHWLRYEACYLLLAGLATPLVLSVHTIVSLTSPLAGSGLACDHLSALLRRGRNLRRFAMVLTLTHPLRKFYGSKTSSHAPHTQHGEGDAGDRLDCRLWLHNGSFLRVVQAQRIRSNDLESHDGAVCLLLLGADFVQRHRAAVSLVEED